MKRFLVALAVSLMTALAGSPLRAAPVLSLDPASTLVRVGEQMQLDLRIAGLEDVLGAFSVELAFDPNLLAFVPAATLAEQFGDRLGQPDTETIGIAQLDAPGMLHLDQVSLLDVASLDALQRDDAGNLLGDFVLAQLTFRALRPGISLLDLQDPGVVLSDAAGDPIEPSLILSASALVVPAPGTLWLLLAAGLALAATRPVRGASRTDV